MHRPYINRMKTEKIEKILIENLTDITRVSRSILRLCDATEINFFVRAFIAEILVPKYQWDVRKRLRKTSRDN